MVKIIIYIISLLATIGAGILIGYFYAKYNIEKRQYWLKVAKMYKKELEKDDQ